MVGIIDYGAGNIRSVYNAFKYIGEDVKVCAKASELASADKVVFPGVGNGGDVIGGLRSMGFDEAIMKSLDAGKPFLGICVGLQMLFKSTEEAPGAECLSLLKGKVRRFSEDDELKVPQIGWNTVKILKDGCPIFKGIEDNTYFYFVHSYYCDSEEREYVSGETEYGIKYTSSIWKDNMFAVQFHPERSQANGIKLLENFSKL